MFLQYPSPILLFMALLRGHVLFFSKLYIIFSSSTNDTSLKTIQKIPYSLTGRKSLLFRFLFHILLASGPVVKHVVRFHCSWVRPVGAPVSSVNPPYCNGFLKDLAGFEKCASQLVLDPSLAGYEKCTSQRQWLFQQLHGPQHGVHCA